MAQFFQHGNLKKRTDTRHNSDARNDALMLQDVSQAAPSVVVSQIHALPTDGVPNCGVACAGQCDSESANE